MDIETAPKDGREILGWVGDGCEIVSWWDGDIGGGPNPLVAKWWNMEVSTNPTHWMPLPPAPVTSEEG